VEHKVVLLQKPATVNSAIPVRVEFDTLREYQMEEVTVEGSHTTGLAGTAITTHSFFTQETVNQIPVSTENKAIESVLLSTPGVVPDEDGRMHVRGEDAQLQYVVDGIPITGNLTRVYSSLFNASLVKSLDVQTGSLSAEYGVATAGVLAVTTKSGFDRPIFAYASGTTGSFNNREGTVQVGGNLNGRTALYLAGSTSATDRYLDPITPGSPNHDDGKSASAFGKFSALINDNMDVTALGMYDKTTYSIPNSVQRTPAQNQQQVLDDYLAGFRISSQLSESSLFSGLIYTRQSRATITSGGLLRITTPADTQKALAENERFFIGGKRKYTTSGGQLELSARPNWFSLPNTFKAGVSGEVYPVSEYFTFAITNHALADTGTVGGDDRYLPYDLTRGGTPFIVDQAKTGNRFSGYIQDEVQSGPWRLNLGLRFDSYKLIEKESALSPRVAASYGVNDDIVLRASYNRIVMQAPIENYLVSSSAEARQLTGPEQGSVSTNVQSEKAHVFEIGGTYRANRFVDFDLSGYGKFIDDFIVKVELGNSGVIFPVNLKQGIVAGGELRIRLREWYNVSGFLSVSTCVSRGLVPDDGTTPFAAGLVLGEEGENYSNPFKGEDSFPTEHNQLLTAAFGVTYKHPAGIFGTLSGRFDSGLPFDLTGPHGEALDEAGSRQELMNRGYTSEVIDLLELAPETAGSPDRAVAPHATFDASVGYDLHTLSAIPLKLTVSVLNIFDTLYLYKFESTFGGTHFGVPRTIAARIDVTY
jgi:outer membrane cobalamin receptor